MTRPPVPPFAAVFLSAALFGACRSSPFEQIADTIDAAIIADDTTLITGEATVFSAVAVYNLGPGVPQSLEWSSSDSSVLRVVKLSDNRGSAAARSVGTAYIIAVINVDFVDSVQITVVDPGTVRWRTAVAGPLTLYGAVGLDSSVRVTATGGALTRLSRTGASLSTLAACGGPLGPSLDLTNAAFATGEDCTRVNSAAGSPLWSAPFGDADGGLAIASDGAALVLHSLIDPGGSTGAVVVSRLRSPGTEVWRDTLEAMPVAQHGAPAIASNGDVYVAWRGAGNAGWLTRITAAGAVQWTKALAGWPRFTSPAIGIDAIVVTYLGGVAAFDAAGTVLWSRTFAQDNPAASDTVQPSSPVIDRGGNVYVQTAAGLHAYRADGAPRWTADSLAGGSQTAGVGTPTMLLDTTLVVSRGGTRVCGISGTLGTPRWCSPVLAQGGDLLGGVGVSIDRTVYVLRQGGEVIALWNRVGVEFQGWPTEGGNAQRTRRRF